VRFLRNALVAKVSGAESHLLQISNDERTRVVRVAAQFTEEDLTRFMNIALRTHDELGYKQEQRFHLELGIMKMVHAQRLLPLEAWLSAQPVPDNQPRTTAPPASLHANAPARTPGTSAATAKPAGNPFASSSPFASDRARKDSSPKMSVEISVTGTTQQKPVSPFLVSPGRSVRQPTTVGSLAMDMSQLPEPAVPAGEPNVIVATSNELAVANEDVDALRNAVLNALESAGHVMFVAMIEKGEWDLTGSEFTVRAPVAEKMAVASFTSEIKKLAQDAATKTAGQPIRVKVIGGGKANGDAVVRVSSPATGTARSRAMNEPLVQYMQQKFGAEVRTVIDHTDKK